MKYQILFSGRNKKNITNLLSAELCPPPTEGWGGHIVFGTDHVGIGVGVKLLVRSVT